MLPKLVRLGIGGERPMKLHSELPVAAVQSDLRVRSARTRVIKVPLRFTLGTSADVVRTVPIVLIEITTDQGVTGRSYAFAYTAAGATAIASLVGEAVDIISGQSAAPYSVLEGLSRKYRLLGVTGTVRMALSVIDVALWDAQAIAVGVPLYELLEAAPRAIPAYDSRGLGLMPPDQLADEALALFEDKKLPAMKLRLGHPTLAEDVAAVASVLRVLPRGVGLMVDYNQALSPQEADIRASALDDYGLLWIEEPMRHDDYAAQAQLTAKTKTPLQIGENFNGPKSMEAALALGACDYAMPDVARIGGVTGWLQSAALAADTGIPLSSHLFPEISVVLLCASPTAHWLEYVDWADAFLANPMRLVDGRASPSTAPGVGHDWDEIKIAKLLENT
jgi:mandelate racemase